VSPAPIVSVSVDLDAIECYFRIHALPGPPPESARFAILHRCLPRFADLFDRHGIKATFFVVGRDLDDDPVGRRALGELAAAGHELGNHSYTHLYDLTRRPAPELASEVDRAHGAIAACGDLLCERGYAYDSSTFPAVPYYLAKAAVMASLRLRGRKSGSILGRPAVLRAPRDPYRPAAGDAYRKGDRPIIELPMTVTPWLRLPVFGTSLVTTPDWLRRRLVKAALMEPIFNLELHGIDLADADADGFPPALIAVQPDLRVPLVRKLEALDATLTQARAALARFLTLRALAAEVIASAGQPSGVVRASAPAV
jgi:peptidoglycan-N-acetylglucosamine deacetylase